MLTQPPPWPADYKQNERNRGTQAKRLLKMLVMMSNRGHTTTEMAERGGVSTRTVRRDLQILQSIEIPIYNETRESRDFGEERQLWKVDPHWMKRFT